MHSLGFHKQTLIAFLNGIGAEIHTANVEVLHLELPAEENGNPEQKKWNWENLKKFPILKEIFVSGISLPNFFPFLAHLPQLKKVKLTAYELSNLDFSSLSQLCELNLTACTTVENIILGNENSKVEKVAFINCKLANLDLAPLIKLRELSLEHCTIENVGLGNHYNKLVFQGCHLANLDLSALTKLRELTLNSCSIGENVVLNCQHLEKFVSNFYNTDLSDHIEKFLTEINLANLKYVEINTFDKKVDGINILKNLSACKEITTLFIGANIKELPYELVDFANLEEVGLKGNPIIRKYPKVFFHAKGLPKILQEINQKITDSQKRKAYLALFWQDETNYASLTQEEIWKAFQFSNELFSLHVAEIIQNKYPTPLAINFDSTKALFYLLGKFKGWSSTEIKAALKQQNIQVSTKLTDKVTHVLVGYQSEETLQQAIDQKCVLVLPEHLKNYVEKIDVPHLLEAETDIQTSLEALLNSKDENNLLLAFTMMLSGGIPDNLIYHLLILYWNKDIKAKKCKEALAKLIDKHLPTSLKAIAKKYSRIKDRDKLFRKALKESEIVKEDFIKAGISLFKMSPEDFFKTGLLVLQNSHSQHAYRVYDEFLALYNSYKLFLNKALDNKHFYLVEEYANKAIKDTWLTTVYGIDAEIFFNSSAQPSYQLLKSVSLLKLHFYAKEIKKITKKIIDFCKRLPALETLSIGVYIYADENKEVRDLFIAGLKKALPHVRVNIENY